MARIQALLISLLIGALVHAAPPEELVTDLPGLSAPVNFKQYSGYLDAAPNRHLHYWFIESQNDPTKDPLVLWLTGGPGCSSLSALLTENGPFVPSRDGFVLSINPHAWNKVANIVYLESPACVGFSYDDNSDCKAEDDEVAKMNYEAIKQFLQKFPEYRSNEFFVTGESYGGIYVPTLSVKIVEGNKDFQINFQGYAVGNGMLNYVMNYNSLMFFGYYHSLLSDKLWLNMVENCCNGVESQESCDFCQKMTPTCESLVNQSMNIIYGSGLNIYNLLEDCYTVSSNHKSSRYLTELKTIFSFKPFGTSLPSVSVPCFDSTAETNYLNREDVRKALHIPSQVQKWEVCSDAVLQVYQRTVFELSSQVEFLHKNNIRGLVYNGDVDMACNFLMNEWFLDSLDIKLIQDSKPWKLNRQVVGFLKKYDSVDFITVKGGGHMVPLDKPEVALKLFTSFVRNEPY